LGKPWIWVVSPLPHPSESLDWRGLRKNGLQNLEPLGVRGQNLEHKGVAGFSATCLFTANAFAMIRFLAERGKVRCHMEKVSAVDFFCIDQSGTVLNTCFRQYRPVRWLDRTEPERKEREERPQRSPGKTETLIALHEAVAAFLLREAKGAAWSIATAQTRGSID
jgi:hypothetical protein